MNHATQTQRLRLDALVDDYGTGLLDRTQFARAKQTAEAELSRIEGEIDSQTGSQRLKLPVGQTLRAAWDGNPVSWRQSLLELVIKSVTVNPTKHSIPVYEVDGVKYRFNTEPDVIHIEWLA